MLVPIPSVAWLALLLCHVALHGVECPVLLETVTDCLSNVSQLLIYVLGLTIPT